MHNNDHQVYEFGFYVFHSTLNATYMTIKDRWDTIKGMVNHIFFDNKQGDMKVDIFPNIQLQA